MAETAATPPPSESPVPAQSAPEADDKPEQGDSPAPSSPSRRRHRPLHTPRKPTARRQRHRRHVRVPQKNTPVHHQIVQVMRDSSCVTFTLHESHRTASPLKTQSVSLRIRRPLRQYRIQLAIMPIDVIEEVHRPILLRHRRHIQQQHRHRSRRFTCQLSFPESIAVCALSAVHGWPPSV